MCSYKKQVFHIAFGVDEHFIKHAGVTIVSILENNPHIAFYFHVFTSSLTSLDESRFMKLQEKYEVDILIHPVNLETIEGLKNFDKNSAYSLAIYTRLLMPHMLQDITDKFLYLDADMVCLGQLDELLNYTFANAIAAVVHDLNGERSKRSSELNLKQAAYFNSGFLYINIPVWIRNNTAEKVIATIKEYGNDLVLVDQDALNIVIGNNVIYLDCKYNYIYNLEKELNSSKKIPDDVIILHHAGVVKPWHIWCLNPYKNLFLKYKSISEWRDEPLLGVSKPREMRLLSKSYYKTGSYIKGFFAFLKYIYLKLK